MRNRAVGAVLKGVRTLLDAGTSTGVSDGQLLERFLLRRDDAAEVAFAALVERHGPMVLRTCRGVLHDVHAAEDAFQATFLILARKAPSIRQGDSVASWLFGVARRVAVRADAQRKRRARSRNAGRRDGGSGRRFVGSPVRARCMRSRRRSIGCRSDTGRRSSCATSRASRTRKRRSGSGCRPARSACD